MPGLQKSNSAYLADWQQSEFLCHRVRVQGDLVMKKEFPPLACKCSLTIHAGCRSGKACDESYRLVCRVSLYINFFTQVLWGFSVWGAGFTELVSVLPGEWLSARGKDGHKEMVNGCPGVSLCCFMCLSRCKAWVLSHWVLTLFQWNKYILAS